MPESERRTPRKEGQNVSKGPATSLIQMGYVLMPACLGVFSSDYEEGSVGVPGYK